MPIYEYKCSHCGNEFEVLVLRAQETVNCPSCGFDRCDKWLSSFRSHGSAGSEDFGSYAGGSSGSGCGSCSSSSCAGCASR
ncbi:MAG: zinc ribbon domain-containing protein [Deltaproteobacteria bacterium]|nr:zinc ribbon domain-containing protein [Deltaproteobacteria bacterium]